MKDNNPSPYNLICSKCTKKCKQLKKVQLLVCPRFDAIPVQLELKLYFPKTPRKKSGVST